MEGNGQNGQGVPPEPKLPPSHTVIVTRTPNAIIGQPAKIDVSWSGAITDLIDALDLMIEATGIGLQQMKEQRDRYRAQALAAQLQHPAIMAGAGRG